MLDLKNKKKLPLVITVYCLLILIIILIGQFSKISGIITRFFEILSPLIIGFTTAYLLNPILNFFEKKVFKFIKNKRLLRCIGIFFTYTSLVLFLLGVGFIVIPQVAKSISELISGEKFDTYRYTFIDTTNAILEKLKANNIIPKRIDATEILNIINDQFMSGKTILETVVLYLANNIESFLIVPRNILLGFFISFYALFTKERLAAQAKKLGKAVLRDEKYEKIYHLFNFTHSTFGGYFTGVVIDAVFVGIITFLFMVLFGIPNASLVAVLVAITNVIPIFGPFLGAIPSAILIFISEPSKVIPFIILILIIQQIDGNIVAPKILGNSTGMSSLAVIIAITIMGSCFGFLGMFIGVPVFAVIISVCKEIVEENLQEKELPIETSCYYPRNSIVDSNEEHVRLFDKLKNIIVNAYNKLLKKLNKNKNDQQ